MKKLTLTILALALFCTPIVPAQTLSKPDSLKHYQLQGRRAIKGGDLETARAAWTRVLQMSPDNFEALLNLGTAYTSTGRNEQALVYFRKAYEVDSSVAEVSNNLGAVYANLGRPDESISAYRRAIRLDSTEARYYANLGLAYIEFGRPHDALAPLRTANSLQPGMALVLYSMANAFASQRVLDSAEIYYTKAANAGNATAELLFFLGTVQRNRGNYPAADTSFRAALVKNPDYKECRQALGLLLLQGGRYEEATMQFEQVVQLDNEFYPGVIALGVGCSMTGRFAEADSILQTLYAVDTAKAFQMLNLIDAESARRRSREKEQSLQQGGN